MPFSRSIVKVTFVAALMILSVPSAFPQNVPPSDNAGSQAERFRMESEKREAELKGKKTVEKITVEEEKKTPAEEKITFLLKSVKITGATRYPPETFRPYYEGRLGKEVSMEDLDSILEQIKARYAKDGYLTANVYLPEQDIAAGAVEIRVLEGKMGELVIEGNKWRKTSSIRRYFHTGKDDLLSVSGLQKDLLRLNSQSDFEATTVLAPGKELGTTDVTLKVKDHFPWHVGTSVDNQGTRLTGKYRSGMTVRSSNVSGFDDTFFSNTMLSDHSVSQYAHYEAPLSSYGTAAGFDYTFSENMIGKEYRSNKISGTTHMFNSYLSQELYLSEQTDVKATTGMDIVRSTKEVVDTMTNHDELRLLYGALAATFNDKMGQSIFRPKFNFSTDGFLGASHRGHPSASRNGTGGFFFKYEQDVTRIQKMPFQSYAILHSTMQVPTHTLPSSEQFQLGGYYTVRGYPEGDYLADWGFQFNCDWIFPVYGMPETWKLPFSKTALKRQLEPVVFVDHGYGRIKKVQSGEQKDKFLMGLGGGLRYRFDKYFSVRAEWAAAVGDRPQAGAGASDFHLLFQLEV